MYAINHCFDGKPADYLLRFEDVTIDTPCGNYAHPSEAKRAVDIADELCYGRDDLMRVAESIATAAGDINMAEDLCDKMASAAKDFLLHVFNGGTYSVTKC